LKNSGSDGLGLKTPQIVGVFYCLPPDARLSELTGFKFKVKGGKFKRLICADKADFTRERRRVRIFFCL
jgi:hypothetical protein